MPRVVTGDPQAGLEAMLTHIFSDDSDLISVQLTLTTSITPGDRAVQLGIFNERGYEVLTVPAAVTQPFNSVRVYRWLVDVENFNVGTSIQTGLPRGARIGPGWTLRTTTTGIAIDDKYSAITMWVR